MTDIVERLRDPSKGSPRWQDTMLEAADEIERLRKEVASLRLTLGGKTFGPDVPEPVGCPLPGACAQVAEIKRLRNAEAAARREGIEMAAREMECGCPDETKAAVLEALREGHNSVKRWQACGHSQCSTIDAYNIRALKGDK